MKGVQTAPDMAYLMGNWAKDKHWGRVTKGI